MRYHEFTWRKTSDAKPYRTADIQSGSRRVQVTESPSGRSLQIHVLDAGGWRKVYP